MPVNRINNDAYRPTIVIPCYNHGSTIDTVLEALACLKTPCVVVDDGSNKATAEAIDQAASTRDWVSVVHLPQNQGKGGAVLAGIRYAKAHGFTHALQIDADGQHAIEDAKALLTLSKRYPEALISGKPIYDESVPKKRLIGRYVTHFWVWVETLSFEIQDSLCGFRVYPVDKTLEVCERHRPGLRMDFDPEVMVRLFWAGAPIIQYPTRVIYPEGGISHFKMLEDNVKIAKMHTRLVFESPKYWLARCCRPRRLHWSGLQERKSLWGTMGFKALFGLFRWGGRPLFSVALYPVVISLWLTGKTQRQASIAFLEAVKAHRARLGHEKADESLQSLTHFFEFGQSILDKMLAWQGRLRLDHEVVFANEESRARLLGKQDPQERGKLLVVSHLGVVDACRAICQNEGIQVINVLIFDKHARRFKEVMEEVAPNSQMNIIAVDEIGMETAMLLEEKVARGEWVAIAGDRTPVGAARGSAHVKWASFLGQKAPFPIGPALLSQLLKCEVLTLFALRYDGKLHIEAQPFRAPLTRRLTAVERQEYQQAFVEDYVKVLESVALRYPLNWFNFYDFWQRESDSALPTNEEKIS